MIGRAGEGIVHRAHFPNAVEGERVDLARAERRRYLLPGADVRDRLGRAVGHQDLARAGHAGGVVEALVALPDTALFLSEAHAVPEGDVPDLVEEEKETLIGGEPGEELGVVPDVPSVGACRRELPREAVLHREGDGLEERAVGAHHELDLHPIKVLLESNQIGIGKLGGGVVAGVVGCVVARVVARVVAHGERMS